MDESAGSSRCSDAASYVRERLPELLDVLRGTDVKDLDVRDGPLRVRLRRTVAASALPDPERTSDVSQGAANKSRTVEIPAPLVGTFYRAGHAGMAPLVEEGSRVEDGTIVGIIEALTVLTEIEAGCTGAVTRVLATDGQPVEYGQPLFEVVTSG